jgi:hypothetical protein
MNMGDDQGALALSERRESGTELKDVDARDETIGDGSPVRLSVCVPCYSGSAEMVQESIDSAAVQLPAGAELVVLPNGPRAIEALEDVTLPAGALVFPSTEVLDMVTNWNRCLESASGTLIHILHEDDAVAPGFYRVITDLAERFPTAALYSTASQAFDAPEPAATALAAEPELLEGFDAARFLLVDDRHACGNIVLTRQAIDLHGGFLHAYEFSLDEEAFLRYAATGGIAFHPAPLYRNRVHGGQLRYSSWLRPEFIQEFVGGRIEGARPFGSEALELAERSSVERTISVAVTLALAGHRTEALEQLERLEQFIRPHRSRRITVAKGICRSRVALGLIRARRRLIVGRRE